MEEEKKDRRADRMANDLIAAVFSGSREGVERVRQTWDVTTQKRIDEEYRLEAAHRYRIEAAAYRNCPYYTDGIPPRQARFVAEGTPQPKAHRTREIHTSAAVRLTHR